jgi:hypothetical protein
LGGTEPFLIALRTTSFPVNPSGGKRTLYTFSDTHIDAAGL